MRTILTGVLLVCLTSCAQPGTTYERWQAKQEQKARIEKVRREATEMGKTPVTFTPEEQARTTESK